MPKRVPPITDVQVRNAKASEKDYKLSDGGGIYLLVTSSGGKLWRIDYRYANKRKTIALGEYPDISIAKAREKRAQVRQQLSDGVDPSVAKKEAKREQHAQRTNTFEKLAYEWYERQTDSLADTTKKMLSARLKNDIFPVIGDTPLDNLNPRTILEDVLRPIEGRGVIETAHRVKGSLRSCAMA